MSEGIKFVLLVSSSSCGFDQMKWLQGSVVIPKKAEIDIFVKAKFFFIIRYSSKCSVTQIVRGTNNAICGTQATVSNENQCRFAAFNQLEMRQMETFIILRFGRVNKDIKMASLIVMSSLGCLALPR